MKVWKRFMALWFAATMSVCLSASYVYALGQSTATNMHGVTSSTGYVSSDIWYDDNKYENGIDQTVEASQLGGALWAKTSPYSMHGYLNGSSASEAWIENDTEDELFVTTKSGDPASLSMNFNLDFSAQVIDQTIPTERYLSDGEIEVALWADGFQVDRRNFVFRSSTDKKANGKYDYFMDLFSTKKTVSQVDGNFVYATPDKTFAFGSEGLFNFSQAIILSTDGWTGKDRTNGLIDSGTYLPLMLSISAEDSSGNLIIDYSNSFNINGDDPYDMYDEGGNKLAPTSFTLASLENFDQPGTAAVPEPATMLLFGSGLVGAFIKRRKA